MELLHGSYWEDGWMDGTMDGWTVDEEDEFWILFSDKVFRDNGIQLYDAEEGSIVLWQQRDLDPIMVVWDFSLVKGDAKAWINALQSIVYMCFHIREDQGRYTASSCPFRLPLLNYEVQLMDSLLPPPQGAASSPQRSISSQQSRLKAPKTRPRTHRKPTSRPQPNKIALSRKRIHLATAVIEMKKVVASRRNFGNTRTSKPLNIWRAVIWDRMGVG